jgi:hypothetical protein
MYLEIIDDFLTKSYHKNILELLLSQKFDWMYCDDMTDSARKEQEEGPYGYGFAHYFWDEEKGSQPPLGGFIEPALYQMMDVAKCEGILRARADLTTWSKDEYVHLPHVDYFFPNVGTVYYVNESDGDTILYNVKPENASNSCHPDQKDLKIVERVSPKANRLALFDGALLHTGSSPSKHKNRILINSNFSYEAGLPLQGARGAELPPLYNEKLR